jgi:hypothetical protein
MAVSLNLEELDNEVKIAAVSVMAPEARKMIYTDLSLETHLQSQRGVVVY